MYNPYYNAFPTNNSIYNPATSGYSYTGSQMPKQEIVKVNGEGGAKAYQMPPNSSALLLDETQPIIWLKTTDGAGYPAVSAYKIEPYTPETVSNNDIEKRVKRLEDIINESYTFDASKLKPRESVEQNHGNQNNDARQKR